jgi:predicted HNH restriction endonuclease
MAGDGLADGGSLACEVCKFDFAHQYGERGQGYIECHRVEPPHIGSEKQPNAELGKLSFPETAPYTLTA